MMVKGQFVTNHRKEREQIRAQMILRKTGESFDCHDCPYDNKYFTFSVVV